MSIPRSAWALALLLPACSDHGARGGGPHDYVRCMAVDAPDEARGTIGPVRWAVQERRLTFTGLPATTRIAAFRGAGLATSDLREAVLGVKEQDARLVFVLGGLGSELASARAHLDALGALGVPVVVLPGGDDAAEAFGDAFEATPQRNLFDGRRLREVIVGAARFALIGGAPEGRYAISSAHCGNDEEDREVASAEGRTYLVSWAAPSGGGAQAVGRGFDGIDAGDPRIATLARALGNVGGLFAFPSTRALVPATADGSRRLEPGSADPSLRLVVPRIAGPSDERDDFGLVPNGAALLDLSASGLAFVGETAGGGGG